MTKRIALVGIGLVVMLGALFVIPANRALAQTEAQSEELAVLKQTLDTLTVALNLMNQRIRADGFSSEELQQLVLTLQTIEASLLTINATISGTALAGVEPSSPATSEVAIAPPVSEVVSQPVIETPAVSVSQSVPETQSVVTVQGKASPITQVTAVAETAETESASETASVSSQSNWRTTGRTIWFIAVAVFIVWSLYAQPWRRKVAEPSPKTS